jgi:hypothetical protein
MTMAADSVLDDVRQFHPATPAEQFGELKRVFPESHFERLFRDGFHFHHTTFWYTVDRKPENIFESIVDNLKPLAAPGAGVIGVEWWFALLWTNTTPQWLLPCHFDKNDLDERDISRLTHPDKASILFLNTVPYGELVVTSQVMSERGNPRPRQPTDMRFIAPTANRYVVFPGQLYHGVLGRMWRPLEPTQLRITMAVNWWSERPKADYLRDSLDCMSAFKLNEVETAATPILSRT